MTIVSRIEGNGYLLIGPGKRLKVRYKITASQPDEFSYKRVNGILYADDGWEASTIESGEAMLELKDGDVITINGIRPSHMGARFYVNGPVPGL